ncbi:glutamate racemase [Zophobihabitans entericus]|uniref:Glutamate racemase n=1 Tax=Zophobihabitans entericus TaxID=1635327 RepID=A0A6G9IBX2_9GAMM|nr:glutamate racemase [Zophobihabitans entericus]QIQ21080.1 glutamate racemase [Zophobihabitans entericus]
MNSKKAIPTVLVFDSGIGGLSVYNEIRQLMPDLHYIYAFDNEGFPYGDKPEEVIIERVCRFVEKIDQQYQLDIAVIACNTASTICLPALREKFKFPIVGVVPAIKPATQLTKNKYIGLLATKATINRAYTADLIKQFAVDCQIELLGLSELAWIAEDKLQGQTVDIEQLRELMQPWLTLPVIPDTIILGCTHYPFIKDELQQVFPDSLLIDSGVAIGSRVAFLLKEQLDNLTAESQVADNIAISSQDNARLEKLKLIFKEYNLLNFKVINIFSD